MKNQRMQNDRPTPPERVVHSARMRLQEAIGDEEVTIRYAELVLAVDRPGLWSAVKARVLSPPHVCAGRRVWRTYQLLRAIERMTA